MFANDLVTGALGPLATAAVFGLLVALYREHREPFLLWATVAWGASLAHAVSQIPHELDEQSAVWAFVAALALALKSLAFLAAGLVYRRADGLSVAALGAGAAVALFLAALQTALVPFLPTSPSGLRELPSTLAHAAAIVGAGLAFWPQPTAAPRMLGLPALTATLTRFLTHPLASLLHHARGLRLLAISLLAWGLLQLTFLLPLPATLEPDLLRAAAFLQGIQSVALVMLVLDRARQRAEYMRSFNQTLLDGMDLGLALVAPDLRIQHTNRWMTERFGRELMGRRCIATYLAQPEQCPACPWRDGARENRQLTIDGPGNRRFQLTCSPLTAPDGSTVLLELVSDVTEQDAMRARLLHSERLATVGEMASRVAHELRNPLTIMNVHADLARRELTPETAPDAVRYLGVVKGEIRRVANLVESYLQFARSPTITPHATDLSELLTRCLATFQPEFDVRGIVVSRQGGDDPIALWADAEPLGRVFANLFRNAIEAMPKGGALTVITTRGDAGVAVEITDTGPGIGADDVERIFRPFHTTKPLGAGLGLALAREIVAAHGGTLGCRSQEGGCFVVVLPIRSTTDAPTPEMVR